MQVRKILVPTDLSPEGERAFQAVGDLAQTLRATVVLLHVVENAGVRPIGGVVPESSYLAGTREELERVRAALDQRRSHFPAGVEAIVDTVVAPSVPQAIVDYANKKGCDWIVLSTHGRGGFRRLVLGSVAESVLRSSRVPTLVFPRQD